MERQTVCIVGGGATGAALLWCLGQDARAREKYDVTLIHDAPTLGGHSYTVDVDWNGSTIPVDLGVQLVSPMVYPNLRVMLALPDFRTRVPMTDFDDLRVACAFPDADGQPQNWGNFPEYQDGPLFTMYSDKVFADSERFRRFMEVGAFKGWFGKSLKEYFAQYGSAYADEQFFVHYFLWPYLSIINGYGAALMGETTIGDLIPFFAKIPLLPTPLGSVSVPGKGWQRFTFGAATWVQAMAEVAQGFAKSHIIANTNVTAVYTDTGPDHSVHVLWTTSDGASSEGVFDKVVLTTDMHTTADLLDNEQNALYWDLVYKDHIDKKLWPLQPGACYIHSDPGVLSPHLRPLQREVLQFTAYWYSSEKYPYYDMYKSFTTYIQANLLANPAAVGLYNTMYGYIPDPDRDKVPDPSTVIFHEDWTHGHFAPSFEVPAKKTLYLAQAPGLTLNYPGQQPTNVYLAGNNTTYDSEEGALEAAMIIANYAFGVDYPLAGGSVLHPSMALSHELGAFLYKTFYSKVMFPGADAPGVLAEAWSLLK
jgi:hypothetical protein